MPFSISPKSSRSRSIFLYAYFSHTYIPILILIYKIEISFPLEILVSFCLRISFLWFSHILVFSPNLDNCLRKIWILNGLFFKFYEYFKKSQTFKWKRWYLVYRYFIFVTEFLGHFYMKCRKFLWYIFIAFSHVKQKHTINKVIISQRQVGEGDWVVILKYIN